MSDEFNHLPKTRAEARASESKLYFTGVPCKNGHVAPRRVKKSSCLACELEASRRKRQDPEYAAKERERSRLTTAYLRAYDSSYVEKKNEHNRIYAAVRRMDPEHRERINHFRRVLWRENEKYRLAADARSRRWMADNPERMRALRATRAANERGAEGSFTEADILKINVDQGFRCKYCGTDTSETYHVDHVAPLARGGSNWPSNLQILCPSCNCSKGDKTHDEFLAMRLRDQAANDNLPTKEEVA